MPFSKDIEPPDSHAKWIACPIEEEYFSTSYKDSKQEKKIAKATDRSKQKKTDRDQKCRHLQRQNHTTKTYDDKAMRGRILAILPQGIIVHDGSKQWICSMRGNLKKQKWESKNFIAVGDFVHFVPNSDTDAAISDVEPRYSVLSRADNLSRRKEQFIAANIDQVLITLSVANPELKPSLADRYIIAACKGKMTPIVVVNKIDLLSNDQLRREKYEEFVAAYQGLGVNIFGVSVHIPESLVSLRQIMKNKTSVFSGQSGTGKSSLINVLVGSHLRTGSAVHKTNKGAHTTTTAQLLDIPSGGWVIDTPGIRSFGLLDVTAADIRTYFSDISNIAQCCYYPNCSHVNEPKCAVLAAIETGSLSSIRLESYYSLLNQLQDVHVRR